MDTYTKDEQVKLDTFTLRQLFDEKEISYELAAKRFVRRAILEMEKMPSDELDYIARHDPDVYEVFVRLARPGIHTRATASGATGTASGATGTASGATGTASAAEEVPAEEVPVCSSGAGSSRSSVSTSGSSGGSAPCSS